MENVIEEKKLTIQEEVCLILMRQWRIKTETINRADSECILNMTIYDSLNDARTGTFKVPDRHEQMSFNPDVTDDVIYAFADNMQLELSKNCAQSNMEIKKMVEADKSIKATFETLMQTP